jgi:hypothetical protein
MKTRVLLKDIPGKKFHSAIFTSYSFNFYYLEQQVLPLLYSKGINYISILVDSKMLDSQLESFGSFSESNKRSYSLYGIHSNYSFHPKIIYLIGDKDILILVGSGNLTTSGHGKNLETWNPIFINIEDQEKKPFAKYIWEYIDSLFNDLGNNAQQKLRNIEKHSPILTEVLNTESRNRLTLSENETIHFLYPKFNESIYHQVRNIIGEATISRIIFMSPFYDEKGSLIEQFDKEYNPENIDIILQHNFGKKPSKLTPKPNMKFFNWSAVKGNSIKQNYFHAKNILFIGNNNQFLISGSANVSVAAFGNTTMSKMNEEACFIYESQSTNYLDLLELNFSPEPIQLKDIKEEHLKTTNDSSEVHTIKIISLEKFDRSLKIVCQSELNYKDIQLILYISKRNSFPIKVDKINKGRNEFSIIVDQQYHAFYAHFSIKSQKISNNQFVIDLVSTEKTNPSKQNRTINKFRADLDDKFLSSTRIIEYLNSIQKYKTNKPNSSPSTNSEEEKDEQIKDEEIMYLSYEELQNRIKDFSNTFDNRTHPINHHSINIWDIISLHLKTTKQNREQKKYDHDETEDVDISSGNETTVKEIELANIKAKAFEENRKKVINTFNKYIEVLRNKIKTDRMIGKPQVNDLSMFLIIIDLLIRLVEYKELVEQEDSSKLENHLLKQKFSHKGETLSQFIIEITGLFTLWVNRAEGFEQFDNTDYQQRLKQYKEEAFKASLVLLSLFNLINEGYKEDTLDMWVKISLLNINKCFNSDQNRYETAEPFDYLINDHTFNVIGEETIHEEINKSLNYINSFKYSSEYQENDFFEHKSDGICYILHLTQNAKTGDFLKLINTGYDWDSDINNYWNHQLYGIKENKWYSTK